MKAFKLTIRDRKRETHGKKLKEQEGTWAGFGYEQCREDPAIPPPGCGTIALQRVPSGRDLPRQVETPKAPAPVKAREISGRNLFL